MVLVSDSMRVADQKSKMKFVDLLPQYILLLIVIGLAGVRTVLEKTSLYFWKEFFP